MKFLAFQICAGRCDLCSSNDQIFKFFLDSTHRLCLDCLWNSDCDKMKCFLCKYVGAVPLLEEEYTLGCLACLKKQLGADDEGDPDLVKLRKIRDTGAVDYYSLGDYVLDDGHIYEDIGRGGCAYNEGCGNCWTYVE